MSKLSHQHPMVSNDEEFICNCCNKKFEKGRHHVHCPKCYINICLPCYTNLSTFQSSPVQSALYKAYQNPYDGKKIYDIYDLIKKLGCSFSSKFSEQVIDRAHSRLFLFAEQKDIPEYELKPTRIFTNEKGETYAFFGSWQAKENVKMCKDSVEAYLNNHWVVRNSSRFAPELEMELSQSDFSGSTKASYYSRNTASGIGFILTLGIGAIAERQFYRPIFESAMSSARFQNALLRSSSCSFLGCLVELDKDYHLRPSHLAIRSFNISDHNLKIDWSCPDSIPRILSILSEIKRQFPNLKMNRNENEINILFSVIDYIDEGTSVMSRNPLFTDDFTTKMIAFTRYSILDTQIYLRLEPKSLEIFNTTSVPVYQTDKLGDKMNHSFLTQAQFTNINKTLLPDIREELSRRTTDYSTVNIDPLNIAPAMEVVDSLITSAEIKLAQIIGDITNNMMANIKTVISFWSVLQSEYLQIASLFGLALPTKNGSKPSEEQNQPVKNVEEVKKAQNIKNIPNEEEKDCKDPRDEVTVKTCQTIHDSKKEENINASNDKASNNSKELAQKEVSSFVEKYWNSAETYLAEAISNNIVPSFYSERLAPLKLEIAQLKHIKELIFLSAEIERRKNDNIPLFNIDLGIENCETCLHKYHINMIV